MGRKSISSGSAPQWAFRSRLRRGAFGWRGSKPAIARIDEALAEIRAIARKDPVLAAEGAVLFLEKVSPAVRDVDSSSGALGSATYGVVEALVPIIAAAPVSDATRAMWLDRLFEAIQEDDPLAAEAALAALHWMSLGHGYQLTGADVREAYRHAMEAAQSVGEAEQIQRRADRMLDGDAPAAKWMRQALEIGGR